MKGKKAVDRGMYYRAVRFEVRPTPDQVAALMQVSEVVRLVYNEAIRERRDVFNTWIAPIYNRIKLARSGSDEAASLREELKTAFKEHRVTLFDQINALTARRRENKAWARVPRNWQEETLDALDSAFKSFLSLRKRGDHDARAPRDRREDTFSEISGRSGVNVRDGNLVFACPPFSGDPLLTFPIPDYQRKKLDGARAKKFTLYRDEPNMKRPGRLWVSVVYELPLPQTASFLPDEAVYVSLGASSVGIVSPRGEEVVKLWRPDKYWERRIEAVETRMGRCTKGSRAWRKRVSAKRVMQRITGRQQTQNHCEVVVQKLLAHGRHFIVTELVVRSKKGHLADSDRPERGGRLGLNWAAQNTGSIGHLVRQLQEKVKELGGSVRFHKAVLPAPPETMGHENKLAMTRSLRTSFLASL